VSEHAQRGQPQHAWPALGVARLPPGARQGGDQQPEVGQQTEDPCLCEHVQIVVVSVTQWVLPASQGDRGIHHGVLPDTHTDPWGTGEHAPRGLPVGQPLDDGEIGIIDLDEGEVLPQISGGVVQSREVVAWDEG